MFTPKVDRIRELSGIYPKRIEELETIFFGKTNVYIDFANVIGWQDKLGWHIDLKRLKQLLDSFSTICGVKLYYGTLTGDIKSEQLIKEAEKYSYDVVTKPVKVMKFSIDISSISSDSPEILKQFIREPLLQKMDIETIVFLNTRLKGLNKQGLNHIETMKCNFDVEIGRDMLLDYAQHKAENFILWSGDSDFADPIRQLLTDVKKVVLFATARRVATELSELRRAGLFIFDIQKIKDFICWKREITSVEKQKGLKSLSP
jgi:uncharacterized LabA/DUF88 family protein